MPSHTQCQVAAGTAASRKPLLSDADVLLAYEIPMGTSDMLQSQSVLAHSPCGTFDMLPNEHQVVKQRGCQGYLSGLPSFTFCRIFCVRL